MKNSGLRHRVISILILLIIYTPFLVGRPLSSLETTTEASPLPLLFLEPSNITANPGETFTVDIKIANVTDLYDWSLTLTWSRSPLLGNWLNVTHTEQGEFLKRGGQSTYWITPKIDHIYGTIKLGCTRLLAPTGETGNGTLAIITFGVTQGGNSTLHVYDTTLKDSATTPIIHTVQDAYFYTTVPLAYFTYSPSGPRVGQPVTFNATLSCDPDGGTITSYYWDFGDGTSTTETDPVTEHVYTEVLDRSYRVNVTVTDDDAETWTSVTDSLNVWIRDIAITDINVSPTVATPGTAIRIDVTAWNEGNKPQTEIFNVTAYYSNATLRQPIETKVDIALAQKANTILTFNWNTTGTPVGVYTIEAVAEIEFDSNLTNNELVNGEVTVASVNEYAFPVVVAGATFQVNVETSSTVSNFAFNQVQKEISFDVSGPENMSSLCNVKIPKALLNGNFTVLINGTTIVPDPIVTPIDSYHFVNFTFTHNLTTHSIQIRGTTVATPPVASFTVNPELPYVGETVTFNATDSEDPDGEIFSYMWDFGDGNVTTVTDPTITHAHISIGDYTVILTVTDNDGLESTATKSIYVHLVYNVAISNVTVSPTTAKIGEIVSTNVTVSNDFPGVNLNINITAYFDNNILETQSVSALGAGESETVSFAWDTASIPEGTYTIKATVLVTRYATSSAFPDELNTDDNTFIYGNVTVQKWTSVLSISASPTSPTVHEDTLINGSISPERAGVEITIMYRLSGSQTWSSLTTVLTAETGEYSYTWTPDSAEIYELKATWGGDESTLPDESDTITVTVNKISSTISLSLNQTSVAVDSNIGISGDISPAVADVEATIEYSRDGEPWTTLATVSTDSNGHYSYDWVPEEPGTYELRASWTGDAITVGDESGTQTLTVQQAPTNILLYVGVGVGITAVIIAALIYFLRRSK